MPTSACSLTSEQSGTGWVATLPPVLYIKRVKQIHPFFTTCVRLKCSWTLPSRTTLTGTWVTPALITTKVCPPCICTITKLLRSVRISSVYLMEVGNLTPPNLVSMLSSMSSAMHSLMVSFRRILHGTFVITKWCMISSTVTLSLSLPDDT